MELAKGIDVMKSPRSYERMIIQATASPPYTTRRVAERFLTKDFSSTGPALDERCLAYMLSLNWRRARQSLKVATTSRVLTPRPNQVNGAMGCRVYLNTSIQGYKRDMLRPLRNGEEDTLLFKFKLYPAALSCVSQGL